MGDGRRELSKSAAKIMGANEFGIHPRQACLANSLADLKKRLVVGVVKPEFEKVLEAAQVARDTCQQDCQGVRVPTFVLQRVGHQDGFFRAFLEFLVERVLLEDKSIGPL